MAETQKHAKSSSTTTTAKAKARPKIKGGGGGGGFTRRCVTLVKEQRAKIYILRRCATMLLCWYIHGDDH